MSHLSDGGLRHAFELGNGRSALEAICSLAASDPLDPTHWAIQIERVAAQLEPHGVLCGDRALEDAVRALFGRARLRLPENVERLWHSPVPRIGVANFPIACRIEGIYRGSVRRFHAGARGRGRFEPGDSEFRAAIERALRSIGRIFGNSALEEARSLEWRIEPDLPGNARLAGSSVGLAAFMAFASRLLHEPIPERFAFTGVPAETGREFTAVAADTFSEKLEALREGGPHLRTLFAPGIPGEGVIAETDAQLICRTVFARPLEYRRGSRGRTLGSVAEELRLRLRALLDAAIEPLPVRVLYQAASARGVWHSEISLDGIVLEDFLEDLDRAAGSDSMRELAADRALAIALASPEVPSALADTRPLHLWRGGSARRAIEELELLAAKPGGIAAVLRVLKVVPAAAGELRGSRSPHALLAYLAFRCAAMPPSFSRLSSRLTAASNDGDQLLCLQAIVETVFHLLASCSLATVPVVREHDLERRRRMAKRPNLGELREEAELLIDAAPPVLAELVSRLRPIGVAAEMIAPLNEIFHRFGRWQVLPALGAQEFKAAVLKIAGPLSAQLEAIADFDFGKIALGELVQRADDGTLAFHRGVSGGRARYWNLANGTGSHTPTPRSRVELEQVKIQHAPLPVARALIELRRALRERESTLGLIGAIDLAVESTLRLIWFALCPRSIDVEHPISAGNMWLPRMTKRALFEQIAAAPRTALSQFLTEPEAEQALLEVIDELERFEHVPGPIEDQRAAAESIAGALVFLLARAPWNGGGCTLAAESASFMGPMTKAEGFEGAREVLLSFGEERYSLWPFAIAAARRGAPQLCLLAHASRRTRSKSALWEMAPVYLAIDARGQVETWEATWRRGEDRPLGVEVEVPR